MTHFWNWKAVVRGLVMDDENVSGLLVCGGEGRMVGRSEILSKLRRAEADIAEMKKRRADDAKANEKVVTIFAKQEQCWLSERKKLRQHLQALLEYLGKLEKRVVCSSCVDKEAIISNLKETIKQKEIVVESKVKDLEEQKMRKDLEEKLQKAEAVAKELREMLEREAREHFCELWKHKTAFMELVSNQRELEAEMGRALRHVEQKEESMAMVQKLSVEVVRMVKDLDQKEKIISTMLRKSKLDTTEKQKLLKELRLSKAKRKQAELETERWRACCESKEQSGYGKQLRRNSAIRAELRSEMKRSPSSLETGCSEIQKSEPEKHKSNTELQHGNNSLYWNPNTLLPNLEAEKRMIIAAEGNGDLSISTNIHNLGDWVRSETEKHRAVLEKRHHAEIEAFSEQMRLKDEKLEAFRWQLLSMELESKRLHSRIEGLDESLSRFRDENVKLEALMSDKEKALKYFREKISSLEPDPETIWSEVKIVKRKPREKEQEHNLTSVGISQEMDSTIKKMDNQMAIMEAKLMQTNLQYVKERKEKEGIAKDMIRTRSIPPADHFKDRNSNHSYERSVNKLSDVSESRSEELSSREIGTRENPNVDPSLDPEGEIEEKVFSTDHNIALEEGIKANYREVAVVDKSASVDHSLNRKDSLWKTDVHALGVSYKIKRLKQKLLMLENLTETQAAKDNGKNKVIDQKDLVSVMSLLKKQVRRYQSLEERTDDLCRRIHENDQEGSTGESNLGKTKEKTEALEQFLEETIQLQRYMVATGQKSVEIQSLITSNFVDGLKESTGFDVRQFSDGARTLLKEIQRGLDMRIARIIGDLEGTLACEGILHLRN